VLAEAKERGHHLNERHATEMRNIQAELQAAKAALVTQQEQDKTASQQELLVYQTRLQQQLQDQARSVEAKLLKDHSEREAELITEAEQLRSELREREHQMARALHKKDTEWKRKCEHSIDDVCQEIQLQLDDAEHRATAAEAQEQMWRERATDASAAVSNKVKAVQAVMQEAAEAEKAELRAGYEEKLAKAVGST